MHDNARILSYHDLFKIWPLPSFHFKQLDINCSLADRFPTSWSVQRGHHFFLFKKYSRQNSKNSFQRHLQRTIGRSASNIESSAASTSKSPATKKKSAFETATATPTKPQQVSGAGPGDHPLAEREYRESQAYATAFPSLSNETNAQNGGAYLHQHQHQHNKEIPQLNNSRQRHVEIVDESGCGCNVFATLFSGMFSSRPRQVEKVISCCLLLLST